MIVQGDLCVLFDTIITWRYLNFGRLSESGIKTYNLLKTGIAKSLSIEYNNRRALWILECGLT